MIEQKGFFSTQSKIQKNIFLQSILSTMNQLSPFVDQVVRKYSHSALEKMFQYLAQHPGEKDTTPFKCALNQIYVVKRLISSSLARQANIKFNAYFALSTFLENVPHFKSEVDVKALQQHIFSQTDIKKHCQGKFSQIQAYAIGKILIFKALSPLFIDNLIIINHLIQLFGQNSDLEDQIIEVLKKLVKGKKAQLSFNKINPQTKSGFVLFSIFKSQFKGQRMEMNPGVIDDVLEQLTAQYPKRSISLGFIGVEMRDLLKKPQKYLTQKFETTLSGEEGQVNVKMLHYLLQLLQAYLSNNLITKDNVWKVLTTKLLECWLSQLKVQNKYIRRQAENIKLQFEEGDEEMAFDIMEKLHQQNVNLSNINSRHPLFPLLQMVEPEKYLAYLLDLCTAESEQMQDENEQKVPPVNQLEVFVTLTNKNLKAESITKVIQLFVFQYKLSKDEKYLQNISRLLNSLLPQSHKKKQKILIKQSLILSKINFQHLELGQLEDDVKTAFKNIRLHVKENKDEEHPLIIGYINFMVNVGFYFFMHPEQVQIYDDLKMAFVDIKKNYLNHEEKLIPKKKRKVNQNEQKVSPIHVLVDIFISLLTKSPQFLRNSINHLFQQIIPFVDGQDLSHLLQVIQRPDKEYIEQIQNE